MIRLLPLLALSLLAPALAAAEESTHDCTELDGGPGVPYVEGLNGTVFRVDPDLTLFQPFSDASADRIADLARALEAGGTTLVYVPVPTRGLAMTDALPPRAQDLAFEVATGDTYYLDMVKRLQDRGVRVPDARLALRAPEGEGPSFLPTDPRMTGEGARRLAAAIAGALEGSAADTNLPKAKYETRESGSVVLASQMRDAIQNRCLGTLPDASMNGYATSRLGALTSDQSAQMFGGAAAAPVVLVGTSITGEPAANLAGFVSEATGLEAQSYATPGEDGLAAISSYMTSRGFEASRPSVLVWLNPVWSNVSAKGDQPMAELIASARNECGTALPVSPGTEPGSLIADLGGLPPGSAGAILLDADSTEAHVARFDFLGPDGSARQRGVWRDPGQFATGRFYVPLTGLWPQGAFSVTVTLDVPFGPMPRILACAG